MYLVCSVEIFEPYIKDKNDPIWIAWVKHIEYFQLMFLSEITKTQVLLGIFTARPHFESRNASHHNLGTCPRLQIVQLDKMVYEATEAFTKVPEFKGFLKPKHHFAAHASVNTLRMGPMRGFWCYSYEGLHQRVKRIARNSNFRNVAKRIAKCWSIQFAACMKSSADERRRLSNLA
jgi:hypothetical protein